MFKTKIPQKQIWLNGWLEYRVLDGTEKAVALGKYPDGQKSLEYPFVRGKLHGTGFAWYEDGTLKIKEEFNKGKCNGWRREWFKNGQLMHEAFYKNGKTDGEMRSWYRNGQLQDVTMFCLGNQEGKSRGWYASGKPKYESHYREDRRHGICKSWHASPEKETLTAYIRGVEIPLVVYEMIQKNQLTATDIIEIENSEQRRICLEELGYERFLAQMDHEIIEEKDNETLIRIHWHKDEEPLMLVRVRCHTTFVFYTLRVPPTMKKIKEAVAWTFGVDEKNYEPTEET